MPLRNDYIVLPQRRSLERELTQGDEAAASTADCQSSGRYDPYITWSAVGVACCTGLSFILFAISLSRQGKPSELLGQHDFHPSPYMHLDSVLSDSSIPPFQPVVNFPPITLQLNNSDKSRHMLEDDRQRLTGFGTVYPDDRHIAISDKMSTVAQFRNMDYAMESCVLHAVIPTPGDAFDPTTQLHDPSEIDIWFLDVNEDLGSGSMIFAPARRYLLATLTISRSAPTLSEAFRCPSGLFTTIELSCKSATASHCLVDFWQDQRARPLGGIYMMQHSTHTEQERSNP